MTDPLRNQDAPLTKEQAMERLKAALWQAGAHVSMTELRAYTTEVINRIDMAWSS